MKRLVFTVLPAVFSLLFLSGCKEPEDPTPPSDYKLSVSPTALAFPAEGGSQDFRINTDAPSTQVRASDSWLSVAVSDDVVTVTVEAHTGKDSRTATVTVTAGSAKAEVSVAQTGKTNRPADDPYPTAQYGLADHTVFVPADMCKAITSANQTVHTFTVPMGKTGSIKPETGLKMILNTPTEHFPDGLLAEVVSVKESGGNYEVTYKDLKLEEAFTDLVINETDLDIAGALQKVLDPSGKPMSFTRTRATDQHKFHIEIPEASWPTGIVSGMEFSPAMEADVTMTLQAIVANAELYTFNVNVETDVTLGGTLSIGADGNAVEGRKPLLTMVFSAIPIGPVLVTPFVELSAVYYISGKVSVEATAKYKTTQTHGVHYDINTGWCPNDFSDRNNNGEWVELSVAPKLEGSIAYGLGIGPYVGIYGKVVGAGVSFDVLEKETVSEAFNFLDTDVSQYADWNFVQHLQNIDYTNAIVASASFNVQLVGMEAASLSTPEFTIWSQTCKILPAIDLETFEFNRTEEGMEMTVDVKNPHLVGGRLYAVMNENGEAPLHTAKKVYFRGTGNDLDALNEGEEKVTLTAVLPLEEEDPDMLYADIMYLTEYSETPVTLASIEQAVDDKDARAALIGILRDLYKSHDGQWADCNWFQSDIPVNQMKHVRVSHRGGKFYYKINLPASWKVGSSVSVDDHTKNVDSFGGWEIIFEDGATETMTDLAILDSHFLGYYISIPYNHVTNLTINSPVWTRFSDMGSGTVVFENLDLSRTPLEVFDCSAGAIIVHKKLVLKECGSLKKLSFSSLLPESFDVTDCKALEEVNFTGTTIPDGFLESKGSGTENAVLTIENASVGTLKLPNNYKELLLSGSTFDNLVVRGNKSFEHITLRTSKGTGIEVKDCAKMSTLSCPDTGISSFEVENLPNMSHISVDNNKALLGIVPEVFDEIADRGGTVNYDIRYSYSDDGSGTIEYVDNGFGFWYEGEPECGYHGKEPPQDDDGGYVTHPGESAARAAFRKVLQDLYRSRKGEWEGCNWLDGSKALGELAQVSAPESQSDNETYSVRIPESWQFGTDVLVKKHNKKPTSQYPGGEEGHYEEWMLYIDGARTYNSFTISDPRCYRISMQGEAKTFAVHSNSFFFQARGSEPWKYRSNEIPSKIETLDLRGCAGYDLDYQVDYEHTPKVIKLRRHDGKDENSDVRVSVKYSDSTPQAMPSITLEGYAYMITVGNARVPYGDLPVKVDHLQGLCLIGCTGDMIYAPENIDYMAVGTESGSVVNGQPFASGVADIKEVKIQDHKTLLGVDLNVRETVTINSCPLIEKVYGEAGYTYTVKSCPKATTIMPAARDLKIQDCKGLQSLYYPDTYGPVSNLEVDGCPALTEVEFQRNADLKSIQMTHVDALTYVDLRKCTSLTQVVPSFFEEMWNRGRNLQYEQRYDYSYSDSGTNTAPDGRRFNYTDKGYGFYYADEPGSGRHRR